MAKVKPGWVAPGAAPESRGRFLILDTKHGTVVQKWPKRRGKAKSGYNFYRQKEFGIAARMAANPLDLDLATAIEMVKGTTYVPRDFLTSAAFGRAYIIETEDGTEWPNYRDVTNNPQYVLDLITETVGTIIYRAEIGWVALMPGSAGQVLTMKAGLPTWQNPQPLPPPPVPDPVMDPVYTAVLTHSSNTATFSAVPLGDPLPGRTIAVAVSGQRAGVVAARNLVSVTLNGSPMVATQEQQQSGSQCVTNIYRLHEDASATADIVVTYSGTLVNSFIGVFALYDLESAVVTDTARTAGPNPAVNLDVLEGGIILGVAIATGGTLGDIAWDGLAEIEQLTGTTESIWSVAAYAEMPEILGHTVSVSSSATTEALVVASFR